MANSDMQSSKYSLSGSFLLILWLIYALFPNLLVAFLNLCISDSSVILFVEENIWIQFSFQLIAIILVIILVFYELKRNKINLLEIIGLSNEKAPERSSKTRKIQNRNKLLIGLGCGFFFVIVRQLIAFTFRFISINYDPSNIMGILIYGFLNALVIALFEEFLFRGVFQNQLKQRMPQSLAIIIIAFLTYVGKTNYIWKWEIVAILFSSIIYGYLYATSGNIFLTIGWHFAYAFIENIDFRIFNYTYIENSYIDLLQIVVCALVFLWIIFSTFIKIRNEK